MHGTEQWLENAKHVQCVSDLAYDPSSTIWSPDEFEGVPLPSILIPTSLAKRQLIRLPLPQI